MRVRVSYAWELSAEEDGWLVRTLQQSADPIARQLLVGRCGPGTYLLPAVQAQAVPPTVEEIENLDPVAAAAAINAARQAQPRPVMTPEQEEACKREAERMASQWGGGAIAAPER